MNPSTSRPKLSVLPMLLLTLTAFVCLTLITFSLPLVHSMYFLWSSQAGGVRFGIWGWCLDEGSICSETLGLGYAWDPEVSIPITKALILYPLSAVLVFLALVTLILVLMRNKSLWALRLFVVFVWSSFVSALVAFVFMIAMWSVIEERFKADGWKVRWGPLPWMSFVTVLSLLIVVVSTWKGSLSTSHDAVQHSSFRVEPILGEDFEKAIVSSDPSTPTTSISGSQATITVPRASHSSLIVMTEDRGSTPNIRRACCQCQKRLLGKPGWLIEPPAPAAIIGRRRKIIGVELSPFAS
ncbi:hypothetical protein Agabi119p4_6068 [Agaricus bisporus var. burnettii]|uniref:Uncharacterized protein n=1 Tax=Agaricus bisporus var. burnettii TaxID=192524 RepID=A0A8H7F150_AGABI|nr:hypothetical protein Agabi119p4_6068 [Agaricus bisporus var. burnettii]